MGGHTHHPAEKAHHGAADAHHGHGHGHHHGPVFHRSVIHYGLIY